MKWVHKYSMAAVKAPLVVQSVQKMQISRGTGQSVLCTGKERQGECSVFLKAKALLENVYKKTRSSPRDWRRGTVYGNINKESAHTQYGSCKRSAGKSVNELRLNKEALDRGYFLSWKNSEYFLCDNMKRERLYVSNRYQGRHFSRGTGQGVLSTGKEIPGKCWFNLLWQSEILSAVQTLQLEHTTTATAAVVENLWLLSCGVLVLRAGINLYCWARRQANFVRVANFQQHQGKSKCITCFVGKETKRMIIAWKV